MANDYLSGSQFGQVAGTLLARRKRQDKDQAKRALFASALFETIGAFKRKQQTNLNEEIQSYQDAYVPIFKNLEVNFQNAQKTKEDLLDYDRNPEVYKNKRIDEEFFFSNFAKNNNITRENLDQIKGTPYEKGYQEWVNNRRLEIDEEINLRRNNPYVQATSYEELASPIVSELKNKIREVQNDPNKTSLLRAAFNKIFGKQKAGNQAAMEVDVEDFMIEYNKLEEGYNSFKSDLNNFYKEKAAGQKAPWMGFFKGKPVFDKYFKNTDKEILDIIDSDFEGIAGNKYNLKSSTNPEVFFESTPFDEVDEIKVLTVKLDENGIPLLDENKQFIYEENKNKNAATELARYITYTSNMIAASDDADPNRIAIRDVLERRGLAINELIRNGNLAKESRMGKVVFKVPLQWGMNIQNIDPETISVVDSMINQAEETLRENTPLLETQYESYIRSKIDAKKAKGEDFALEQNKLSPADDKEYLAGQLEFLFNPPEELVGTAVMVGGERQILGKISQAQKEFYYEGFKNEHQVRNITLEKLLGLGEEPFREATEAEFNAMNEAQKNLYNSAIANRLRIIENMDSPDISLDRRDLLRNRLKKTEINIAGLIENRGTTTLGRVFSEIGTRSELGRIEANIKNTEERLANRRALTPQQIQDTEDRLKQLKQRKQELELGL